MAALRVIFMGTAELACASLDVLLRAADIEVAAVVTQPDRPRGRELKLQPSPVKQCAFKAGRRVLQPERARDEAFIRELADLNPELIAVAAYGQILPRSILDLPPFGCINVHTSLLPKYRGAAPIQWAILNDEPETGVTIMKMDPGMDTGDILRQEATKIEPEDNAETLHDRLGQMGAELLIRTVRDYVAGKITPKPQPAEGASHARKITKEDGRLDWTQSSRALWCRLRAMTPWPGAFTHLGGESRPQLLKIWRAEMAEGSGKPGEVLRADKSGLLVACGVGALHVLELQQESGRRMNAAEFIAGHKLAAEHRLQ